MSTSKIEKNKPCPCGSGKKYKKCCMKSDMERHRRQTEAWVDANKDEMKQKRILDEMPAYLRMQIFATDDVDAGMRMYMAHRAHWQETIATIEQLDESALVNFLARLKVNASTSAFMRRAKKHTSAFALSETWRKNITSTFGQGDDAFFRLSICKLWQLRLPNRPSIEMIDDWMQEGYTLWMTGYRARGCDRWAETWRAILPLLKPEMRNTGAADKLLRGTQHIHDWLQDFLLELQNAAMVQSRFADTGIDIINQLLQQFPDESHHTLQNWRGDLGQSYYLAGRFDEGERVFQNLIRDFPDHAEGYARFADILAFGPRDDAPIDIPRAIALIEKAITRPVIDATDYDLQARLNDLKSPQKRCCN